MSDLKPKKPVRRKRRCTCGKKSDIARLSDTIDKLIQTNTKTQILSPGLIIVVAVVFTLMYTYLSIFIKGV